MTTEFLRAISELKRTITKKTSVNVNSEDEKTLVVESAKSYFSRFRPYINSHNIDSEALFSLDNYFQELIRLTQGNNPRKAYNKNIKIIESIAKQLTIKDIIKSQDEVQIHYTERLLLQTLEAIVPTAALSYKQTLIDLNTCTPKISFRGTASEIREALRETLDHLAPDENVIAQSGFKLENGQTKPTMKQKVRYILKTREVNENKRIPAEKSAELVDEIIGQLARATYNRASLSAHLETTKSEVIKIKRYVDIILFEILEIS